VLQEILDDVQGPSLQDNVGLVVWAGDNVAKSAKRWGHDLEDKKTEKTSLRMLLMKLKQGWLFLIRVIIKRYDGFPFISRRTTSYPMGSFVTLDRRA